MAEVTAQVPDAGTPIFDAKGYVNPVWHEFFFTLLRRTGGTEGLAPVISVSGSLPITSTGGINPLIGINVATETLPGSMSASDKAKLDGISAGATINILPSIVELLSAPRDIKQIAMVAAYYPGAYASANPVGDTGGGAWHWDANTPKTQHDGGTIISPTVPWDGTQAALSTFLAGTGETAPGTSGCWILTSNLGIRMRSFGALGDSVSDDTAAVQASINAAIKAGRKLFAGAGIFKITSTITIDNSAATSYLDNHKIDFQGEGIQSTRFVYYGTGNCLQILGGSGAGVLPMISMQKISGFTLIGLNTAGTIGLYLDTTSEIDISNIQINSFDLGLDLVDVDFATFDKLVIQFNARGVLGQERFPRLVNSTRPNSLDFRGCKIGGNGLYGAYILGGSCVNFYGGHIEGNGTSNGLSGWGIKAEGCGVQGGVGINLNGVYFEANQGIADVWIVAVDPPLSGLNPYHCVNVIQSCDMHRVGSTQFVTNNIKVSINSANAGKQKVVIRDSAFKGFGTYIPNAARKYVAYDVDAMNAANFFMEACIQQDDVESVPQLEFYNTSVAINAVQSIPNAALTTVSFNTENFDADNLFVIGSPTIITVPVTGKYQVSGCANFQSNAVGARVMRIVSNGSTELVTSSTNAVTGGNPTYLVAAKDVQLTKGDTISMRIYQDSTASLNLQVNSTYLELRSVGP